MSDPRQEINRKLHAQARKLESIIKYIKHGTIQDKCEHADGHVVDRLVKLTAELHEAAKRLAVIQGGE